MDMFICVGSHRKVSENKRIEWFTVMNHDWDYSGNPLEEKEAVSVIYCAKKPLQTLLA
jgi:hypothetical protein